MSGKSGLKASYTVGALALMFGWTRYKVRRWVRSKGVETISISEKKIEVPLKAIVTADPRLWESVLFKLQLERA